MEECALERLLAGIDGSHVENIQRVEEMVESAVSVDKGSVFEQLIGILGTSTSPTCVFCALALLKKYVHVMDDKSRVIHAALSAFENPAENVKSMAANVVFVYGQSMEGEVVGQILPLLKTAIETGDVNKMRPYVQCLNQFAMDSRESETVNVIMKVLCEVLRLESHEVKKLVLDGLSELAPQLYGFLGEEQFPAFVQDVCQWLADPSLKRVCYVFLQNAFGVDYNVICRVAQRLVEVSLSDIQQESDDGMVLQVILMWTQLSLLESTSNVSHMVVTTVAPSMVPLLARMMKMKTTEYDFTCKCSWDIVSASFQCLMQFATHLFHIVDPILLTFVEPASPVFSLRVFSIVAATASDELFSSAFENMQKLLELCCSIGSWTLELQYWTIFCLKQIAKRDGVAFESIARFADYAQALLSLRDAPPEIGRCAASFYCWLMSKIDAVHRGEKILAWLKGFNQLPVTSAIQMFERVADILLRPQTITIPDYIGKLTLCKMDQHFARSLREFIKNVLGSILSNPGPFLQFIETLGYTILFAVRDSKLQLESEVQQLWELTKEVLKLPGQTLWLLLISNISYCNHEMFARHVPEALTITANYLNDDEFERYRLAVAVLSGMVCFDSYSPYHEQVLDLLVKALERQPMDITTLTTIVTSFYTLLLRYNGVPTEALAALLTRIVEFIPPPKHQDHDSVIKLFDALLSLCDVFLSIPIYLPLVGNLLPAVLDAISAEKNLPDVMKATIRTLLAQLSFSAKDEVIAFVASRPALTRLLLDI